MFDTEYGSEYDSIPAMLVDLQAGPELGGILACIDVDRVSPHDRVLVLRAESRMRSHYDARFYQSVAAVANGCVEPDDHPSAAFEAAAAEIRAALRLTRRSADVELTLAKELRERLPRVWEALADGSIDLRRARVIADRTAHLTAAEAWGVVERVIDHAARLTTGQLRARLDRLCLETDPDTARDRYQYAVKDRRVATEATSDGTANLLGLDLPPHRVHAISRRINHIARSLKTRDETRTIDQLRADVYLDLLAGTYAKTDKTVGGVHLHVDLDTLAALSEHSGELAGYGPVIADIARQAIAELEDTEWRFLVTDTATGQSITTGVTRRRPNAALRRGVEERTPTCVFPGCRMPSVDCDLDHNQRWADGGPTTRHNLAPACRHDHRIKDELGWSYRPLADGDYLWTSRLGHQYTTSGTPP